jgi:hypothetical protein
MYAQLDIRDWLIGVLVASAWMAATVYLFKFHSDVNYATYAGLCITMTGFYHFIVSKDPPCQPSSR